MTYKSILRIPVNQEKLTKKKKKIKQILNQYELTKTNIKSVRIDKNVLCDISSS